MFSTHTVLVSAGKLLLVAASSLEQVCPAGEDFEGGSLADHSFLQVNAQDAAQSVSYLFSDNGLPASNVNGIVSPGQTVFYQADFAAD